MIALLSTTAGSIAKASRIVVPRTVKREGLLDHLPQRFAQQLRREHARFSSVTAKVGASAMRDHMASDMRR